MLRSLLSGACALFTAFSVAIGQGAELAWEARSAEHLLNRAAFGARPSDVEAALLLGHEACVERLLNGSADDSEPFSVEPIYPFERVREMRRLPDDERRALRRRLRRQDLRQLFDFRAWWIDEMMTGSHPLRERMTLFWHGFFTSSAREVKSSVLMIRQNELFREHALGNFRELAHAIVRDPAMLKYLDNDANRKEAPNENLARELMELFTLGEGNYTEQDVKEAARALTGWSVRRGEFSLSRKRHDADDKEVLGERGRFDADDLIEILLAQDACPRWLAGRLLEYFEGSPASDERLDEYADWMREIDFDIARFLERLFADPHFYSDEVVGSRIASPVDYLVGTSRRLGIQPPALLLGFASSILGEQLFSPPSVQGWPGGRAWISTSSFMQRGNIAGVLVGVVSVRDVLEARPEALFEADADDMEGEMSMEDGELEPAKRRSAGRDFKGLKLFDKIAWRPFVSLSGRCERAGADTPESIVELLCDELLAVDATSASRASLVRFLEEELAAGGLAAGRLAEERGAESVLRRLAHLVLSLPEAQLH